MSLLVSSARRNSRVLFEEETGQPSMWTKRWINYPFECCKINLRKKSTEETKQVTYEKSDVQTKDGKVITVVSNVRYSTTPPTRNIITILRKSETISRHDADTIVKDVIISSISDLIPNMEYPEISKLKPEFSEKIFLQVKEKLKTTDITIKSIDVVDVCTDEPADLPTASKDVDDTELCDDDEKYLLDIENSNKNESGEVESGLQYQPDEYDIIHDIPEEKQDEQDIKEITEEINENTQEITKENDGEAQDEVLEETEHSEKPTDNTDDDFQVISDSEAEVGGITIAANST